MGRPRSSATISNRSTDIDQSAARPRMTISHSLPLTVARSPTELPNAIAISEEW